MATDTHDEPTFETFLEDDDPACKARLVAMLMESGRLDREVAMGYVEAPYRAAECLVRVAFDAEGALVGWAAATRERPRGWALTPIVVHPDARMQGIGRALLEDLASLLAEDGPGTLYVHLADRFGESSLAGHPLAPGALAKGVVVTAKNRDLPLEFYRRVGFELVGVLPDVYGPGDHELILARAIPGVEDE